MGDISTVRLLIGDTSETFFTDAQIQLFLDMSVVGDDDFLAASVALRSMAADAAIIAKLEKSLNTTVDRRQIPDKLLALANSYKAETEETPQIGIAERAYTVFNLEDILANKVIREGS